MISLTFPLKPLAKQSFKTTRSGFAYQPAQVVDFKNAIRWMATEQLLSGFQPLTGAVLVVIDFQFALLNSAKKAGKQAVYESNCVIAKTTKPDIDNLCKGVFDALNGIVWKDDAQIVQLIATKCYGKTDQISISVSDELRPNLK